MFISAINPSHSSEQPVLWFVFRGNKLLVDLAQKNSIIPFMIELSNIGIKIVKKQFIGYIDEKPCYSAECDKKSLYNENYSFMSLRALYSKLPEEIFWLAGRAFQIIEWDRTHQFCSTCGAILNEKSDERAKICIKCDSIFYPRISPAVIIAITKGDEILLAKNSRFLTTFYSVLAGFVEPGESLEECIKREIMEEVHLKVKNISYFKSQPWPFPNSLMIGFTAQYDSGEIIIDKNELEDAQWFKAINLPEIPSGLSIARNLIDWFIENNKF